MKITLSKEEVITIIETYVTTNMNIQGNITVDSLGNYIIETGLNFKAAKKEEVKKEEPETAKEEETKPEEKKEEEPKQENSVSGILGNPHEDATNLFN